MTPPRTPGRDPDKLISAFLGEGQTELPDHVYDEVRTEVDRTDQRTSFGPLSGIGLNRFAGLVAATAVIAVAAVIGVSIGANNPFIGGPPPSPSPDQLAVSESVTDGNFQLTISAPRATWSSDEAIDVEATLKLIGPNTEATLWGSGSGPIGFSVVEVGGDRRMDAAWQADCSPHAITADAPITVPFAKSGGYSADDPNAAFYEAFFADPELRLPAGEWQVSAVALFDAGDTCTATPIEMSVSLTLTIEGDGEPSAVPTEPAEPSPEASVDSELQPFICDTPISLDAEGSDFHPLITQDIRVGTHDGYDRIVFEYDGGTPFAELDLAQPPFVMDPSGLPMDVDGNPVYRITLTGATKFDTETGEQPYQGSMNFEPDYPQIVQFVEAGDFEATHSWFLGVNGGECLRVFTITDPSRVVIDIQH